MATLQEPARATARADVVTIVLVVVGVQQLATGLLAFLAPGTFYDVIASYAPQNDHFVMDAGSWMIALGAAALYGARRADWRAPLLALLGLQYALHAVPHVLHVDDPETSWHGPFALISLVLAAVVLFGLFVRERGR